jgi:dual 3',5'-cyclic-AMP and -GMP phosphodiesterase 11
MSACAVCWQNLLEVVHDLFEEQTSLEKVTLKIMQRAQRLLKCERAAVLLLDENAETVKFSKLFELTSPAHSSNHIRYSSLWFINRCLRLTALGTSGTAPCGSLTDVSDSQH